MEVFAKTPTRTVILRPGNLDRGEAFRKRRPWEAEAHKGALAAGKSPGLSVGVLARRGVELALEAAKEGAGGSSGGGGVVCVPMSRYHSGVGRV